jgi:hypothetical protein
MTRGSMTRLTLIVALEAEQKLVALSIQGREAILSALDDPTLELAQLRGVLLREHEWRMRVGLVARELPADREGIGNSIWGAGRRPVLATERSALRQAIDARMAARGEAGAAGRTWALVDEPGLIGVARMTRLAANRLRATDKDATWG